MTSGNAFRDGAHAHLLATNAATNGDPKHAHKRRKLLPLPPPQANIFIKTGDDNVSLEVDHMILDYLSYEATKAVLSSRTSSDMRSPSLENKLAMVDTFLKMFKARHPSYVPDGELRFRLLLLKLATLYCSRFDRATAVPSYKALCGLRANNTARAMKWIQNADRMPSGKYDLSAFESESVSDRETVNSSLQQRRDSVESWRNDARRKTTTDPHQQASLERRRAYALKVLKRKAEDDEDEEPFYGTPKCLSLLDLLPLFMAVIAARNELNNSNLSTGLMELAAQFMLQASLEQYLACGATGCDAIDEAFAWGLKPTPSTEAHKKSDSTTLSGDGSVDLLSEVDRMFQDEDNHSQEVPDWHDIKASHIAELAHDDSETLRQHLEDVAYGYPIADFEESVLQLLAGLAASLPKPIFSQLEKGNLDGMSPEETQEFLQDCCGLDAHWPAISH